MARRKWLGEWQGYLGIRGRFQSLSREWHIVQPNEDEGTFHVTPLGRVRLQRPRVPIIP